jgi:hypothetical protein
VKLRAGRGVVLLIRELNVVVVRQRSTQTVPTGTMCGKPLQISTFDRGPLRMLWLPPGWKGVWTSNGPHAASTSHRIACMCLIRVVGPTELESVTSTVSR